MKRALLTSALFVLPLTAAAQDAELRGSAPVATEAWEICNETSYILRVATAYIRDGKISPKGWAQVRPGGCDVQRVPAASPRYVFAESARLRKVRLFIKAAFANGQVQYRSASQRMISRQTRQKVASYIEPDNFGKNAATAGMQRLLKDSGYEITRIDGLPGRRTSRTISAFKKEKELNKDITDGALIDAMAVAAQAKQAEVGLEVCNNSSGTIWTALATRDDVVIGNHAAGGRWDRSTLLRFG